MNWRALIIDDEVPARSHLRELLAVHPDIEIVGEADCVSEAVQLCAALNPSLLFLDLQMPRGSGFELLTRIDIVPEIIFVTAYEQYAVHAFEVNAIDYLLKPVFADRLALALSRLGRRSGDGTISSKAFGTDEHVILRTSKGLRVAMTRQITHIEADGNYTAVWLHDGGTLLTDRTMNVWEAMLSPQLFARVDRSLLLNLAHVMELRVSSRNTALLTMSGRPEVLKIGRAARRRLQSALRQAKQAVR